MSRQSAKGFVLLLMLMVLVASLLVPAASAATVQQYADIVTGYSSQYTSSSAYYAVQALGAPNATWTSGNQWLPLNQNGTSEWIQVEFASPVFSDGVAIREAYGNGFVTQVDLVDMSDTLHTAWTGTDTTPGGSPQDLVLSWPSTTFLVKGVRVSVNTNHTASWEGIDAIRLSGDTPAEIIPPTGHMIINVANPTYSTATVVTLTLDCTDLVLNDCSQMRFSNDNALWSVPASYATTTSWMLAPGDGVKTVYVKFRDAAGNWSAAISDSIILDTTNPAGSITINNYAGYTQSPIVTLTLAAADVNLLQMQFSNDGSTWSPLVSYITTTTWTLSVGDGTKTVYARFEDGAGNFIVVSDSIILDSVSFLQYASVVSGYSSQYTSSSAYYAVQALGAPNATWTSGNQWLPLNQNGTSEWIQVEFASPVFSDGVAIREAYGNGFVTQVDVVDLNDALVTAWTGSDPSLPGTPVDFVVSWPSTSYLVKGVRITVDTNHTASWEGIDAVQLKGTAAAETNPPTGTVVINALASYVTTTAVTLSLTCSDAASTCQAMRFSNDNAVWSAPASYGTSTSWTLAAGDGVKTVYAMFRDGNGNWSSTYSDSIILDTTNPTGSITINNYAAYTQSAIVTLDLSASDTNGVRMQFSNDGSSWSSLVSFASTTTWTLTGGDGAKTVYVRYQDNAGNQTIFSDTIILDTVSLFQYASVVSGYSSQYASSSAYYAVQALGAPNATWTSGNQWLPLNQNGTSEWIQVEFATPVYAHGVAIREAYGNGFVYRVDVVDMSNGLHMVWNSIDPSLPGTPVDFVVSWPSTSYTVKGVRIAVDTSHSAAWEGIDAIQFKGSLSPDNNNPPTGGISINAGAPYTSSPSVTLNLACSDVETYCQDMMFSNDGTNWTIPELYAATKAWTFPAGDGVKTIFVRFQDSAGNWSASYNDTIILDTLAPVTTASPPAGTYPAAQSVTLTANEPATIYYTTNGSLPTTGSPVYSGIISVRNTMTLRFFAVDSTGNAGTVQTLVYTITGTTCTLPPTGLVSWWQGEGNANDQMSRNHGSLVSGATFTAGMVGLAYSFDGVESHVAATDSGLPAGNSARSAAFWMRWLPGASGNNAPFIYGTYAADSAYYVVVIGNRLHIGQWGGGDTPGSTTVTDGNWHHIALTHDGTTTRMYVDAQLDAQVTRTYATALTGTLFMGATIGISDRFRGDLDELMIFDRALIAPEIAAIYNAGASGICDTVAPTVMATIPVAGSKNAALDTTVMAVFSESMLASSITNTTFILTGPSGPVVGGIFAGDAIAMYAPASALASGTTYTATITTGAKDLTGNALASSQTWTFTTASAPVQGHLFDANTVALWRLDEVSASSNAVDETGNYNFTQFGSPDVVAGKINNGRLLNGSSKFFQRPGDANLGTVFNGDWTYEGWVYLDPSFSTGGELFVYNGLAFSFNQSDTILAEVGVLPTKKIFWHQWHTTGTFTDAASNITLQTGQYYHVAVSRTAQGSNLFTYRLYVNGIIDTTTTDVAGPSYPVSGASHYFGLGNYTDISGFGVAGGLLNGRLDDTRISKVARTDVEIFDSYLRGSGSTTDTTPPAVVSTNPPGNATNVPISTTITAIFSEDMLASNIMSTTFLVSGVTGSVTYAAGTRTATFTPSSALASSTTYTATVTTGVKDIAGNALAAPVSWSFTTADVIPPVTTASPAAGLYRLTQTVTLTSSETATIYYTTNGSAPTAPATGSTLTSTNTATITVNATMTVRFFSVDLAGNSEPVNTAVYIIDSTAPVTTATPAGGFFVTGPAVTLTANETATIRYTLNGSNPILSSPTYTAPILITGPTTTLKFYSIDLAGNAESVRTEVYIVDPNAPQVTSLSPGSGSFVNTTGVSYTLNKDMATGSVVFTSTSGTVVSQATYTMSAPDLTSGGHTVTGMTLNNGTIYTLVVSVTDSTARSATATSTNVTYDTAAAVITITSPGANSRVNTATVIYTLNEAITAGEIVILDGSTPVVTYPLGVNDRTAGSHTVNTGALLVNNVPYTFTIANVVDLAGNPTPPATVPNVTYDITVVVITNTMPTTKSIITAPTFTYDLSEQAASGTVTFTRTSGNPDPASPHVHAMILSDPNLGIGQHTVTPSFTLVDGTFYTVSFAAMDLAGNAATTVSNALVFFDSDYGKGPLGNVDNTGSSVDIVDNADVIKLQDALGTQPGHGRWNPVCDLDRNNVVDMFDLMILHSHYGQKTIP